MEEHFVGKIAQKAIIVRNEEVLLVRDPTAPNNAWELPGGRLNKNELPQDGLIREIREELGVGIKIKGLVDVGTFYTPSRGHHLTIVYRATLADPAQDFVLQEKEVAEIRWITRDQLYEQPIFKDNLQALSIFFALKD